MSERQNIVRSDLRYLVGTGHIQGAGYKQGLDFFWEAKDWNRWALVALFALGVGHILAGIIFFFAFNWNDISSTMKFGIVQGGIVLSVLLWVLCRLDSLAGQAFGIAATVLVGVLLAVFGQVFQTPAAIYTPFILWAVLTLPFALASRSVAHWTVWMAIALFGVMTFIGDGLSYRVAPELVRLAYFLLAIVLLGLSALYHIVSQTRFPWAKTSWFRLSILLVAFGILFGLFTEAFTDDGPFLIWGGTLVTALVTQMVAYRKLPTLPALSLMAFFTAMMVAQFGFKFIFEILPDLGDLLPMFLAFIWMASITYGLAKLFWHFQDRFGGQNIQGVTDADGSDTDKKSVAEFSAVMGFDEIAIEAAHQSRNKDDAPWYVELLLGLSGVLTAVFAGLFLASIIAMFFADDWSMPALVLGIISWGGAMLLRLKTTSKFSRHFFNTLMVGGGVVAILSLGEITNWGAGFILGGFILSVATLVLVKDTFIEFIMGSAIFGISIYALEHYEIPLTFIWLSVIFTPLAVLALTMPLKRRLYDAAGAAMLFLVPITGVAIYHKDHFYSTNAGSDWVEIIVSLCVTIAVVFGLNRLNGENKDFRPPLIVLVPLLLAMAFMPVGSAAALLTVLVGYILGSRAITLIGIVMQIYFLFLFYYDLQITLLNKSILLLVSGAIFVTIWFIFRTRVEVNHA